MMMLSESLECAFLFQPLTQSKKQRALQSTIVGLSSGKSLKPQAA